jgi:phosphoglycolate phosphatase
MAFKAILFDKDGTFVDFDRTWGPAALTVMTTMAKGNAASLRRLIDVCAYDADTQRFHPSSPLLAGSSGDYGPLWAEALGIPFSSEVTDTMDALFAEAALASLAPIGNPLAVFTALQQRGLRLGVVTNDSERGAVSQISGLGVEHCFRFVAGWDSGHGRKPEAGQIKAFLAQEALAPGEVVMVGDTLHDMHAARAAGVFALGVASGPAVPEDFHRHADHVLPSIMAIEAWLDTRLMDGVRG